MKYCWEYTDDYLEYRSSCGLDTKNPRWYIKDFSRYLKDNYHKGDGDSMVYRKTD